MEISEEKQTETSFTLCLLCALNFINWVAMILDNCMILQWKWILEIQVEKHFPRYSSSWMQDCTSIKMTYADLLLELLIAAEYTSKSNNN